MQEKEEQQTKQLSPEEQELNEEKTYDRVFWNSLVELLPHVVPLVNEVFGEKYSSKAEVRLKTTKQVLLAPKEALEQQEMDALVEIREEGENPKRWDYHFECQCVWKNEVAIRILKYAVGAAVYGTRITEDGAETEIPASAVILLRGNDAVKKKLRMRLKYPGGQAEYDVPVMQIMDYTLDEIFDKRLFILLPFYFFRYANQLDKMESEADGLNRLKSEASRIGQLLKVEENKGIINVVQRNQLIRYFSRVSDKLMINHRELREGVDETIMGGYKIWTDVDDLLERGREEGMEQGDELCLIRMVCRKLKKGKSVEQIAEELEEEEARIQVLCDVASEFAPEYDERKILAAVMQLESV